jgi:hypothetical protein
MIDAVGNELVLGDYVAHHIGNPYFGISRISEIASSRSFYGHEFHPFAPERDAPPPASGQSARAARNSYEVIKVTHIAGVALSEGIPFSYLAAMIGERSGQERMMGAPHGFDFLYNPLKEGDYVFGQGPMGHGDLGIIDDGYIMWLERANGSLAPAFHSEFHHSGGYLALVSNVYGYHCSKRYGCYHQGNCYEDAPLDRQFFFNPDNKES